MAVAWPVRWHLGTRRDWNDGMIRDVSRFGAYLSFERPSQQPAWGQSIAIHAVFGSESILVEGCVRWLHAQYGVGIAFLPEEGELAEALVWEISERMHEDTEVSGLFRRPI